MGELMDHYARGDEGAARAVEGRYRAPVDRIARRLFRRAEDREDAIQEAFLKLWRQSANFDPTRGSEDGFVGVVCRRAMLDARRGLARGIKTEPLLGETSASGDVPVAGDPLLRESAGPDTLARDREAFERVSAALARAPREDERLIRLSFFQGLSHREIAERLSRPLATVRTQARRALLRLRKRLSARPSDPPTTGLEWCS